MANTTSRAIVPQATPWFFLALLAVGVAGFFPSYFARLAAVDLAHHAHALTALAWMILLVVQAWLMRVRRVVPHRTLGRISFLLVPLFVISGAVMIAAILSNDDPFSRRFGARLAAVDVIALAYFLAAYVQAIRHRRRMALHARYMASTALLILPPALARLLPMLFTGFASFGAVFDTSFVLVEAAVALLLAYDWRHDAPRAPFAALLAVLFAQHLAFHMV